MEKKADGSSLFAKNKPAVGQKYSVDQIFLMKNSEKMDSDMSSEASETAAAIRRQRKKRRSSNSGVVSPYESIKLEATFSELQKALTRIEQLEKIIQQQATEIVLLKNKNCQCGKEGADGTSKQSDWATEATEELGMELVLTT